MLIEPIKQACFASNNRNEICIVLFWYYLGDKKFIKGTNQNELLRDPYII